MWSSKLLTTLFISSLFLLYSQSTEAQNRKFGILAGYSYLNGHVGQLGIGTHSPKTYRIPLIRGENGLLLSIKTKRSFESFELNSAYHLNNSAWGGELNYITGGLFFIGIGGNYWRVPATELEGENPQDFWGMKLIAGIKLKNLKLSYRYFPAYNKTWESFFGSHSASVSYAFYL